MRVSNLQTGVFSGEIGSCAGQHHFTEGLVVREFQQKDFKVTPQYGKKIKVINQSPDYPMQIMLNLYDLENIKNENNVFEIDYVKVEAM